MNARALILRDNAEAWLHRASLLEIEVLLRAIATELHSRATPDTAILFDYARLVERVRLNARPRPDPAA